MAIINNVGHRPFLRNRDPRNIAFVRTLRLGIWVVAFSLCGVAFSQPTSPNAGEVHSDGKPNESEILKIGPGDLLDIRVFETPELAERVRVDSLGRITLSVGGSLVVSGLVPAQAGAAIEDVLKKQNVMLDPHVSVFVDEYATQGITLLGEVKSPGTYTLFGPHTLYDALSIAGGPTTNQGATITITHRNSSIRPTQIEIRSPNYSETQRFTAIEPGDTIFVARADIIYVVGDVARPGAYYMTNGERLNVLAVVALAAGVNHTAKDSKASIVRPTPTGAQTIPVDIPAIMKNTKPNPVLQASDILVIPRSGAKVLLETALPGATAAVTGSVATALILK